MRDRSSLRRGFIQLPLAAHYTGILAPYPILGNTHNCVLLRLDGNPGSDAGEHLKNPIIRWSRRVASAEGDTYHVAGPRCRSQLPLRKRRAEVSENRTQKFSALKTPARESFRS